MCVALQGMAGSIGLAVAGGAIAAASGPIGIGELALLGTSAIATGSALNQYHLATIRPDQAKGVNSGTVDVATRQKDFYFRNMCVNLSTAKAIDNFFDMYGYACNRHKVPNRSSRPYWNYVKTKGCVIVGSCPAEDIKKMCSIYDNGIRFWQGSMNKVRFFGDYSNNNSPTP